MKLAYEYPNARPLIKLLDTVGNGTGQISAVGNYSSSPIIFKAIPSEDEIWYINFLKIQITDDLVFNQNGYGGQLIPLTNGYIPTIYKNGIGSNLTPFPIKINDHFIHYSFEYEITTFNKTPFTSRAVLRFETPIVLCGNLGDRIEILLHDNFSFLIDHTFGIHGVKAEY